MLTKLEFETSVAISANRGELNFNLMAQDGKHPAKLALRKWCSSNGVPSTLARNLSFAQLEAAWNDLSNVSLNHLKTAVFAANEPAATPAPTQEPKAMNTQAVAPVPQVAVAPATPAVADPLAGLMAYINAHIAGSVNEDRVRQIVEEQLAGVAPRTIQVVSAAGTVKLDERTNPIFERVLHHAAAGDNVLIVGPAGCGKTHLVQQVAKALKRRFGIVSGSAGVSESQIVGWLLPTDGGKFEYQSSEFIDLYEGGESVICFDELDAFEPNMFLCANSALSNGFINVPQRRANPRVNRGENVAIICTANTYGTGADPIYSGRNQMDGATLDRFVVIEMTYDSALERDIAKKAGLTDSQLERFHKLRDKVASTGLLRVISTRALQKVISNIRFGMEFGAALADLTTGWSGDEKQRVGM